MEPRMGFVLGIAIPEGPTRSFARSFAGLVCWVFRGPTGKDESDGEMVVWFQ